jgi:hypothetical protein
MRPSLVYTVWYVLYIFWDHRTLVGGSSFADPDTVGSSSEP